MLKTIIQLLSKIKNKWRFLRFKQARAKAQSRAVKDDNNIYPLW